MPIKCRELIAKIEEVYPKRLAEDYDNVGLLVGDINAEISKVLVCLEVDSNIVDEAKKMGTELIVSHHPLIYTPLKSVNSDDYIASIVRKCIKSDIGLYALHTNFDNANNGMNDILGDLIGIENIKPLSVNTYEKLYKVVVFVPISHSEKVREAILNAGAGYIGKYSHCSFNMEGTGTFMPLEGTSPFIGSQGELERVNEVRIETIVKEKDVSKVICSMLKAHPYEEVAYDIYPLVNRIEGGCGRVGTLKHAMSFQDFISYVKDRLEISSIEVAGDMEKIINKVAILGGDGNDFIETAINAGCDAFVTGDIKHHKAIGAISSGLNIIDAGHYNTEILAVPFISEFIKSLVNVECFVSKVNTNPFKKV